MLAYVLFIIGLLLVIKGGDWFIDSAVWIARITGIPEVLIGATIMSIGTTFPELIVSATSAMHGHSDMALGNAIGSIICNIGIILGICNIIAPTKINSRIYLVKAFLMIIYTLIFGVLAVDGKIDKLDGAILFICFTLYIIISYAEINIRNNVSNKKQKTERKAFFTVKEGSTFLLKFLFGIIFVIIGARLLVQNGLLIAALLGIPDMVISLTAVAMGTSLPELVTSISALIKGHRNMAIGNILGANILDITLVLSSASFVSTLYIPIQTLRLDLPFALLLMLFLVIPTIFTRKVGRVHALVLALLYTGYLSILVHLFI